MKMQTSQNQNVNITKLLNQKAMNANINQTQVTISTNHLNPSIMQTSINQSATTNCINQPNPFKIKLYRTIESFQQFLANIYSRKHNGKFLSVKNYTSYIHTIIKILGITENCFLNSDLTVLKTWKIIINDKSAFKTLSNEYKKDLNSGFEAFINYGRYNEGFVKY